MGRPSKKAIAETQSEANELYRSGNLSQQDFFNSDVSKKLRSLRKELADIEYNRHQEKLENEYHRSSHIQFLKGEYQPTEEDQKAWDSDFGFWSLEATKDYRDEFLPKLYPDIYDPSKEQIENETKPWVDKLTKKDMDRLHDVWQTKPVEEAIGYQVHYLSELFKLPYEPTVSIEERPGENGMGAAYEAENNTIHFWGSKNHWKYEQGNIAHEMWHAHQQDIIDNQPDSIQAKRYNQNSNIHRFTIPENRERYKKQLEEAEAFDFGSSFSAAYIQADLRSRKPINKFLSRFKKK